MVRLVQRLQGGGGLPSRCLREELFLGRRATGEKALKAPNKVGVKVGVGKGRGATRALASGRLAA